MRQSRTSALRKDRVIGRFKKFVLGLHLHSHIFPLLQEFVLIVSLGKFLLAVHRGIVRHVPFNGRVTKAHSSSTIRQSRSSAFMRVRFNGPFAKV